MIELSSPPASSSVEVRKITRQQWLVGLTTARWSLPLILAFQAVLSWLLLRNTIFQDEALYVYAGRQIWQHWLGGPPLLDHYSYYFSGYPYVYPIIAGALDMFGGLELVRSFSLLCMLGTTTCGYFVAKKLFGQKSAIFAALFFVCQGPVLFLSRLATYDALCLFLLAVATVLAVNGGQARRSWKSMAVGPVLVLAFGAKYVALLFIPPILGLLVLCALLKWGWVSMLVRGTLGVLSLVVVGAVAGLIVIHFDPDMLHALVATTTSRVIVVAYSRSGLVLHVLQMVGLPYLVALTVFIFARKRLFWFTLLLLASSTLVPIYHIYKAEMISLDKHLGFSLFFVMPVAGYALASLSGFRPTFSSGRYWISGMALCMALFLLGSREAQDMYTTWPPTNQLANVLNTQARTGSGHYLMEQFEVSRYNLRSNTYNWQWVGLDFFEYTDKQKHYYFGNDAYTKAVSDGYFDLIQLNYGGYNIGTSMAITQAIKHSKKYDLITKIPYKDIYGNGYFWVWRKR